MIEEEISLYVYDIPRSQLFGKIKVLDSDLETTVNDFAYRGLLNSENTNHGPHLKKVGEHIYRNPKEDYAFNNKRSLNRLKSYSESIVLYFSSDLATNVDYSLVNKSQLVKDFLAEKKTQIHSSLPYNLFIRHQFICG